MPAMPLAISTLYFIPFIIIGVALILMLVLFLLARIQNGRFLRPIVTQLSKIPFMRRWFQKMSVAAYERSNPELAGAIKKMQSFGEIKTPEQAQRALAVMTPAEKKAYMELVGEQGQMPEPVNRDQGGMAGSRISNLRSLFLRRFRIDDPDSAVEMPADGG